MNKILSVLAIGSMLTLSLGAYAEDPPAAGANAKGEHKKGEHKKGDKKGEHKKGEKGEKGGEKAAPEAK